MLLSPLRWFLSRHLGFLFFLMSFSVSVSCPPWDSSLNLLRDSVASQFLRDGVLPLGRVFSVSCGCCSFSVCFFSWSSFSVCPWSLSLVASSPLVSGPSGTSGDCSSVPFPSEGSTLRAFLPWFPPDPPRASLLCVESVGRLPTSSVLRLWLTSLSAAVAPPPEGPFPTVSQPWCASHGFLSSRSCVPWLVSFLLYLRISLSLFIPIRLLRTAFC